MGAKPHPLKDEIARLYDAGITHRAIADRLGVSIHIVRYYTLDQIDSDRIASLPFGRVAIGRRLSVSQIVKLDKLARKWGCDNLGDAAIEILRDYLDEQND